MKSYPKAIKVLRARVAREKKYYAELERIKHSRRRVRSQ